MSKKERHNETDALRQLDRKRDCYIKGKIIQVLSRTGIQKRSNDLGNKSWGRIDYLVKCCNYYQIFVKKFAK